MDYFISALVTGFTYAIIFTLAFLFLKLIIDDLTYRDPRKDLEKYPTAEIEAMRKEILSKPIQAPKSKSEQRRLYTLNVAGATEGRKLGRNKKSSKKRRRSK